MCIYEENNHTWYVGNNHRLSVITNGVSSWKKTIGKKDHSSGCCESNKQFERLLKIVNVVLKRRTKY